MLKEYFLEKVNKAIKDLTKSNKLGQMRESDEYSLQAEVPKNAQFGDFAVNVSVLSRYAKTGNYCKDNC